MVRTRILHIGIGFDRTQYVASFEVSVHRRIEVFASTVFKVMMGVIKVTLLP